ncbi:MAG: hypothetical protein E7590_01850 [Ruminococcaceae bacterium]|nr:hypothetical protein [Oscillospiraceae bacterium]
MKKQRVFRAAAFLLCIVIALSFLSCSPATDVVEVQALLPSPDAMEGYYRGNSVTFEPETQSAVFETLSRIVPQVNSYLCITDEDLMNSEPTVRDASGCIKLTYNTPHRFTGELRQLETGEAVDVKPFRYDTLLLEFVFNRIDVIAVLEGEYQSIGGGRLSLRLTEEGNALLEELWSLMFPCFPEATGVERGTVSAEITDTALFLPPPTAVVVVSNGNGIKLSEAQGEAVYAAFMAQMEGFLGADGLKSWFVLGDEYALLEKYELCVELRYDKHYRFTGAFAEGVDASSLDSPFVFDTVLLGIRGETGLEMIAHRNGFYYGIGGPRMFMGFGDDHACFKPAVEAAIAQ